jgi:hypothetical protein
MGVLQKRQVLFTDQAGVIDPISSAIFTSLRAQRTDKRFSDGDTCADEYHTQRRRDPAGAHVWRCAIPQIDLYRGRRPVDR